MSSPLHIFRRHQKILLAVFGVAIMITFTVGGIVMQYQGTQRASRGDAVNPVRVTWVGGQIRQVELDRLRMRRQLVQAYLREIRTKTIARKGKPKIPASLLQELTFPDQISQLLLLCIGNHSPDEE